MAKYLVCLCFVAIAATAINGQPLPGAAVNSASSNTGMNVMSTNSVVSQNDVQNAQNVGGVGLAAPLAYPYAGIAAPYHHAGYPYGYGGYGGFDGYYPGHYYGGYGGYGLGAYGLGLGAYGADNVNSQSSNTGMNVMSSNSVVSQNGIQNASDF